MLISLPKKCSAREQKDTRQTPDMSFCNICSRTVIIEPERISKMVSNHYSYLQATASCRWGVQLRALMNHHIYRYIFRPTNYVAWVDTFCRGFLRGFRALLSESVVTCKIYFVIWPIIVFDYFIIFR